MIKVLQHPSGHYYVRLANVSQTVATGKVALFSALLGPFSNFNGALSKASLISEFPGWISPQGVADRVGDRPCTHANIEGTIVVPPWRLTIDPNPSYVNTVYAFPLIGGGTLPVTHLMSPGDVCRQTILYNGTVFDSRCAMEGLNSVMAYTSYSVGGGPTGYYTRTTTFSENGKKSKMSSLLFVKGNLNDFSSLPVNGLPGTPSTTVTSYRFTEDVVDTQALKVALAGMSQKNLRDNFLPDYVVDNPDVYGDLCQSCIDQAKYVDTNTISYVSELWEVKRLLPALGSIRNPKTWANTYLCFKYGLNLTIQDTKALTAGIQKARAAATAVTNWKTYYGKSFASGQIRNQTYTVTYHYKVTVHPHHWGAEGVVLALVNSGLYPTPELMWDMIPLSFVIDWVANISSALERATARALAQYYTVVGVCKSRKVEINLPVQDLLPGFPGMGTITQTGYQRSVVPHLDLPRVRIDSASEFHNYAELTALIVSRM